MMFSKGTYVPFSISRHLRFICSERRIFMEQKVTKAHIISEAFQWIQAIVLAIIIALLIRAFIFEPVQVQGQSMEPTLQTGERLIVYKFGYMVDKPKRGDIIVIKVQEGRRTLLPFIDKYPLLKKIFPYYDELDYVKRIVGLPGEELTFQDGKVYINGELLKEPYVSGMTFSSDYKIVVPQNNYFVMGDNRECSRDSREIGTIHLSNIKGKAVLRFWPFKSFGSIK